jgi:hypothetical protein
VDGRTGNDVWLMNTDGTELTNLTDSDMRTERYATWSPDGSKLAVNFIELKRVGGGLVRTAAGLEVYKLKTDAQGSIAIDWNSTDTRTVVEAVADPDSEADFWDMDWARSRDAVVYARPDDGGKPDLWILELDDPSNRLRLTSTPDLEEREPSWSPADGQVVFRRTGTKKYAKHSGIYTIRPDGGGLTSLDEEEGVQPDWLR